MFIKPGKSSTEFYYTLAGTIFTLLVTTGIINPETAAVLQQGTDIVQSTDLTSINAIIDGAIKIIAIVMGGSMVSSYSKSRGAAKSAGKEEVMVNETI